jgi:hypothetical protein
LWLLFNGERQAMRGRTELRAKATLTGRQISLAEIANKLLSALNTLSSSLTHT